jgi:hypothetical protein
MVIGLTEDDIINLLLYFKNIQVACCASFKVSKEKLLIHF